MRTTHHQSAAAEAASTPTTRVTATHHDLSMAQVIQQTTADASSALDQSLLNSLLPHTSFNQGASLLGARVKDADASDPSHSKDNGSSATTITTAADALRNSTRFDPAHDPTSGRDLHDDGIRPAKASFQDLAKLLGHAVTDPTDQKSSSSDTGHHPQNPGAPSQGGQGDHHDLGHGRLEGMMSEASTWSYDYKDKQGHDHHKEMELEGHYFSTKDTDLVTKIVDKVEIGVLRGKVVETDTHSDPNTGTTVITRIDEAKHTKTTTVIDSHVWPDGPVKVKETYPPAHQPDPPLEPLAPENSGTHIPDPDHQFTLPPGIDKLLWDDVKQMHQPSHDGDTTNVAGTDIPGMVDQSEATTGQLVDEKARMLGGDRPQDIPQEGGSGDGTGVNGTTHGHLSGVTDGDPNGEQEVHGSGVDERGHEAFKHETPGAAADAPQGNGTDQGAEPAKPVETSALATAIQLLHGRVETGGEKVADKLPDAAATHDSPDQHRPIELHDRIPEGVRVADHHDTGDVFADLIRAAHNPLQSGLAAIHQPAVAESLQHLGLGADIADHGSHAGEDVHAVSLNVGPLAALHETHLDHYAAPVLDLTHTHYH